VADTRCGCSLIGSALLADAPGGQGRNERAVLVESLLLERRRWVQPPGRAALPARDPLLACDDDRGLGSAGAWRLGALRPSTSVEEVGSVALSRRPQTAVQRTEGRIEGKSRAGSVYAYYQLLSRASADTLSRAKVAASVACRAAASA